MAPGSFEPDLTRWDAWEPRDVARRLAGVRVPWCVTAGWALELFHGGPLRPHEDIEIAIPADGFDAIREALAGFELFAVGDGLAHSLDATSLDRHHQTWVREPATGAWRLDVIREPWRGDVWVFRRDGRVRRPSTEVIERTPDGIPYAAPEVALLYKAKAPRKKDEADFEDILPELGPHRRQWLAEALSLVHPGHHWLRALTAE